MCGIAGVFENYVNEEKFLKCCKTQLHRGPDNDDVLFFKVDNFNVALGHQRLSIIDLTSNANQPMKNNINNSSLVFNGEIYNYIEIRKELESMGIKFKGTGDTEVLFQSLKNWGIKKTITKLNGMWAFAWFDSKSNCLYLCRDRFGEKPLYYIHDNKKIVFASEIKALLEYTDERYELDLKVIKTYLEKGIINYDENTFFKKIKQVRPSQFIKIQISFESLDISKHTY